MRRVEQRVEELEAEVAASAKANANLNKELTMLRAVSQQATAAQVRTYMSVHVRVHTLESFTLNADMCNFHQGAHYAASCLTRASFAQVHTCMCAYLVCMCAFHL